MFRRPPVVPPPLHLTSSPRRVCVIGAGAAGLEATHTLREAGHDVVCLEAGDLVGGHWNHDYEFLHLITPRDASGFADHPMPESFPLFPSRNQVRDYLHGFADATGVRPAIRFGTVVTAATPLGEDGADGWQVHTRDASSGEERVETFDALVVANGHHHEPRLPAIAQHFTGRNLHSSTYLNTGDIEGTRVLVVGSGNSGCDLAVDSAVHDFATDIVVRHGHVFQPKTYFGRARNAPPLLPSLPPRVAERIARELVRISVGTHRQYPGMPAPVTRNLDRQLPVVNELLLYWIQHGRIAVRPGIERIEGRTVTFSDGEQRDYDTILWATGFRVSIPFLDDALLTRDGEVPIRVGAGTLPVGLRRLYLVGLTSPRGAQFGVFSVQSRIIARLIDLEGRTAGRLDAALATAHEPDHGVDILRYRWNAHVAATHRWLADAESLAGPPAGPSGTGRPQLATQVAGEGR